MSVRGLMKVAPMAVAAVLVVAACADDDTPTTSDTTASATTTSEAGATTTEGTDSSSTTGDVTTTSGSSGTSATTTSGSGSATTTSGSGSDTTAPTIEGLQDALAEGDLSTIAQALNLVDIEELIGSSEFTFFAPNDEAFRSLSADDLRELLANPSDLTDVLRNHLVTEELASDQLAAMTSVETAAGNTLPVVVTGDVITVGGVEVVEADRDAGPGVIHVIDGLLLPSS